MLRLERSHFGGQLGFHLSLPSKSEIELLLIFVAVLALELVISAMSRFIDDQANEEDVRTSGEELFSSSEGELSDVIPFHGEVRKPRIESDESNSSEIEGDDQESRLKKKKKRYDKENQRGKSSTKVWKSKRKRSQSPCEESILSELKKTNELMASLTKKMKRHESRLKAIENKLSETTSVSSSSNSTPKRTSTRKDVPCEVRVSYLSL